MFSSPDIKYQIDVTKPVNNRIQNLTYKGAPINPTAEFIIATNNYRAEGLPKYYNINSTLVYASPDANRDVLIGYIKQAANLTRANNGSFRSWQFVKVPTAGQVTFKSAPNKLALAQEAGITNITQISADDGSNKGLALYAIDLSK